MTRIEQSVPLPWNALQWDGNVPNVGSLNEVIQNLQRQVLEGDLPFVTPQKLGAVGDGVTDDTAAVTAAHVAANLSGAPVSYAGLKKVALQANAQIPMKTSTDFAGCEIVILGGVNATPSFSTFNTLYVVTDDDCPLIAASGAVDAANLTTGSMFPTLGLFDGHGYARLRCAYQVPDRAKTGTNDYQQTFKVNRDGRVSHPLSTDISAFAAAIAVSYRKTSKHKLSVSNVALTEGAWNNQRVFWIKRCNVSVENFTLLFAGAGADYDNIMEIICIEDASDVWISNYVTTGRSFTEIAGTYCLQVEGGADIYVDGMNAITGWGATGCNYVNGMHYTRCVLNRIDCHHSAHNLFADDCDLHSIGMVYGWGGGVLSVKNSRLYQCPAIAHREDWGGTFFGSMVVDGCEINSNLSNTVHFVDLETNPLGASSAVYAPKTISVLNCKRTGTSPLTTAELVPVAIKVLDAASVVYAPSAIAVHGISCFVGWRFGLRVDFTNLEANPISAVLRIEFSDIWPTAVASTTSGIIGYTNLRTPSTPVWPHIVGSDAEHIHIICTIANSAQITLVGVGINGLGVSGVNPPRCVLDACRFDTPATGYSSPSALAPVGGALSGNDKFTVVRNCEISPSDVWDFSLVSAAIGNVIRNGAATPVLPAAVTPALFFTGWREIGAFQ